jgi:hypothetical protein
MCDSPSAFAGAGSAAPEVGTTRSPGSSCCKRVRSWLEALPDTLQDTATAEALRLISELDLTDLQAIDPPRGFGRD